MIEVRDLVKRYGGNMAVDHLSFTVEKGRVYGFLGPNGAGKSTTMNIMTGYLGAEEGEVIVNGHSVLDEPELAKRDIGYLPELPPLYADMTVYEYLAFAAALKKIPKPLRKEQVNAVIEKTMLADVEDRLIKNLSKGYKQRVGLAQALLGFPPVLILDEPTVGLDPKQILEIRDLIRSLAGEHTVLLSSHILSEVQAVCDQILIIHHGKLLAGGAPAELEQMLSEGGTLELTVKGTPEQASAAVKTIPGVTVTRCCAGQEDGTAELTLTEKKNTDCREAAFRACARDDLPILRMDRDHASLEKIFLELTADDAQAEQEQTETEAENDGGDL